MSKRTPTIAEAIAMLRLALADQAPGFLPVEVVIRGHTGKIRWPIGDGSDVAAARPSANGVSVPTACRQWSPTEKAILEALADGEWKTAITIAEDSRLGRSTSFQAILANLVEAGVLESSHKSGYRLALVEGPPSD